MSMLTRSACILFFLIQHSAKKQKLIQVGYSLKLSGFSKYVFIANLVVQFMV